MALWFEESGEERAVLGPLREFLRAEVAPGAGERDKEGVFPWNLISKLAEFGGVLRRPPGIGRGTDWDRGHSDGPGTGGALRYAKEREQFGRPIAEFEGVSFKLAEMATNLEAAQAKLFASEVAVKACDEAIQILGGYGYIQDSPVERYWRDARLTRIGEGTSEILKLVIARRILDSV